jgi:hypothetical protein
MMRLMVCILLTFSAMSGFAATQNNWEKIDDDQGIQVFRKSMPGSDIVAFKGAGIVDASLETIFWVLCDAEHEEQWVEMLIDNYILENMTPFDRVQYQNFDLPWPLSDRDFVYRAVATTDKQGRLHLVLNSVGHPKTPETKGVRAEIMRSGFVLTPRPDGKTFVEVSIFSDPKGILPTWVINLVQESWPMETMVGIRKQVKKEFVKEAILPPMQETAADAVVP